MRRARSRRCHNRDPPTARGSGRQLGSCPRHSTCVSPATSLASDTGCCTPPPDWPATPARPPCASNAPGPGHATWPPRLACWPRCHHPRADRARDDDTLPLPADDRPRTSASLRERRAGPDHAPRLPPPRHQPRPPAASTHITRATAQASPAHAPGAAARPVPAAPCRPPCHRARRAASRACVRSRAAPRPQTAHLGPAAPRPEPGCDSSHEPRGPPH